MRQSRSKPHPGIKAFLLFTLLVMLAGGVYWALTRVVYQPYHIVDLSAVVDVDERVRANRNGDLLFAKGNTPTLLSNGQLTSMAPPPRMDVQTLEIEAVNDSDSILCVVWPSVHSGRHPALIYVLRNGQWQQLETPLRSEYDDTTDPAVDMNDAGDVAGSYSIEGEVLNGMTQPAVPVLWQPNGTATLFGFNTRLPECVLMSSSNQKMKHLYWRNAETGSLADVSSIEADAGGTLYCAGNIQATMGDPSAPGNLLLKPVYVTIFPSGQYQITPTPRSPLSEWPVTVMRSRTDSLALDGRMLDIDLLRKMTANQSYVGTVALANSHPVTLQDLGTAAGWRRLLREPWPILSMQQLSRQSPPTLADIGDVYQAVISHGKSLTFLNDLISPMSRWQLISATHVDKDGRILCIGKHCGKLHWCMLVPRGRTLRLPQQRGHHGVGA